jgi:photosystem II stability/assembly factor-like uncharacterized protein
MRPMFSLAAIALAAATLTAQAPVVRWLPQASGVTVRLRGVSAVSSTVGWASGAAGTVLRTSDAGTTWQRLTVPGAEALDFRDIDATDARTAHVLSIGPGAASRIYQTSDAGATWTERFVNTDPQAFFDAMTFADADHGVAVSDSVDGRFVILLTANGGRTWTRCPRPTCRRRCPARRVRRQRHQCGNVWSAARLVRHHEVACRALDRRRPVVDGASDADCDR